MEQGLQKSIIIEILTVVLDSTLLEIHFNLKKDGEDKSFSLAICDDGESILYHTKSEWITPKDIDYTLYKTIKVRHSDELGKLINNETEQFLFGMGRTLDFGRKILYYFKLRTNSYEFLFFNNGDEGFYSFDKIEEILIHDIYGFEWSTNFNLV